MMSHQYACGKCNISCSGFQSYQSHINSKNHLKKVQQGDEDPMEDYTCHDCNVVMSGFLPMQQHLQSDKHKKKVALKNAGLADNGLYTCDVCNTTMNGMQSKELHEKGSRHLKRLAALNYEQNSVQMPPENDAADSSENVAGNDDKGKEHDHIVLVSGSLADGQYRCNVCKTGVSGLRNKKAHEGGRKHLNAVSSYNFYIKKITNPTSESAAKKEEEMVNSKIDVDDQQEKKVELDAEEALKPEIQDLKNPEVVQTEVEKPTQNSEVQQSIPEPVKTQSKEVESKPPENTQNVDSYIVSPDGKNETFYCKACNARMSGKLNRDAHERGRNHLKAVNTYEASLQKQKLAESLPLKNESDDVKSQLPEESVTNGWGEPTQPSYYCKYCKVSISDPAAKLEHENGPRHLQMVNAALTADKAEIRDAGDSGSVAPKLKEMPGCQSCGITAFVNETFRANHYSSADHLKRIRIAGNRKIGTGFTACNGLQTFNKKAFDNPNNVCLNEEIHKWLSSSKAEEADNKSMISSEISIIDPNEILEDSFVEVDPSGITLN